MTTLDLFTDPSLLDRANDYFVNVQKALTTYDSLLSEDDTPAIELNSEVMNRMRESMEPYYYDPTRYDSYLEQLGLNYPGN